MVAPLGSSLVGSRWAALVATGGWRAEAEVLVRPFIAQPAGQCEPAHRRALCVVRPPSEFAKLPRCTVFLGDELPARANRSTVLASGRQRVGRWGRDHRPWQRATRPWLRHGAT